MDSSNDSTLPQGLNSVELAPDDMEYLQKLKKTRVDYLNSLVDSETDNKDVQNDAVHLPTRINYKHLVSHYGRVHTLHTFSIPVTSKRVLTYIMTVHESLPAVVFWQQQRQLSSLEGKGSNSDLGHKTMKWKCFNIFSFEHLKNKSEILHTMQYSCVLPIKSLSVENKAVVAAFESKRPNVAWLYELDTDLTNNSEKNNFNDLGSASNRSKKDSGKSYTFVKHHSVKRINVVDRPEGKQFEYSRMKVIQDDLQHGAYFIASPTTSQISSDARITPCFPVLALYRLAYKHNAANNKENKNSALLKRLHTFSVDIRKLPGVNEILDKYSATIDDVALAQYENQNGNLTLPPIVGCVFALGTSRGGKYASTTYLQVLDIQSKQVLKQLKISSTMNTGIVGGCCNAIIFSKLSKSTTAGLGGSALASKIENVIDLDIVIHHPRFKMEGNVGHSEESKATLIFAGRYFFASPPECKKNIWQWRTSPKLLNNERFGFSKCSSMVGLEHNYRLYKLGFRCMCLFDFMYGHGVLLNLSGEEKECVHFSFTSSSTTDVNILNESLAGNSESGVPHRLGGNCDTVTQIQKRILLCSISDSNLYVYACHEHVCSIMDLRGILQ
eukprot:g11680.t1